MEITFIKPSVKGRVSINGVIFQHTHVPGFHAYQTPYDVPEEIADRAIKEFPDWFTLGYIGGGRDKTDMSQEMADRLKPVSATKEDPANKPKVSVSVKKKEKAGPPAATKKGGEQRTISDCAQLEEVGVSI